MQSFVQHCMTVKWCHKAFTSVLPDSKINVLSTITQMPLLLHQRVEKHPKGKQTNKNPNKWKSKSKKKKRISKENKKEEEKNMRKNACLSIFKCGRRDEQFSLNLPHQSRSIRSYISPKRKPTEWVSTSVIRKRLAKINVRKSLNTTEIIPG